MDPQAGDLGEGQLVLTGLDGEAQRHVAGERRERMKVPRHLRPPAGATRFVAGDGQLPGLDERDGLVAAGKAQLEVGVLGELVGHEPVDGGEEERLGAALELFRSQGRAGVHEHGRGDLGGALVAPLHGVDPEQVVEALDRLLGRPVKEDAAPVEQDRPRAQGRDLARGVRDEEDRLALLLEEADPVDALVLERGVPDGQDLVDDEDVGVDVHGDREPQPDVHARRVVLDGVVDELAQLAELDDLVEQPVGLGLGHAEQGRVEIDVLASGQLAVEARAELEEGGDAAVDLDLAGRRTQDAREDLEQRALAGPVGAGEPHRLAAVDDEVDVAQRPEVVLDPVLPLDDPLLEARRATLVSGELLADVRGPDEGLAAGRGGARGRGAGPGGVGRGHSSSAKSLDSRRNCHSPRAKISADTTNPMPSTPR